MSCSPPGPSSGHQTGDQEVFDPFQKDALESAETKSHPFTAIPSQSLSTLDPGGIVG
jgi:hypothetical protein